MRMKRTEQEQAIGYAIAIFVALLILFLLALRADAQTVTATEFRMKPKALTSITGVYRMGIDPTTLKFTCKGPLGANCMPATGGSAVITIPDLPSPFNTPSAQTQLIGNGTTWLPYRSPTYLAITGANAGEKIINAIAQLPATGGTVDARMLEGAQNIPNDIFNGVTKPVTILWGHSTITTVELHIPLQVKTNMLAQGPRNTIFIPSAPNQRVISAAAGTGVVEASTFTGFSIQAHALGSTAEAIDLDKFRSTVWTDVEFMSNSGGDFAKGYLLRANNLCYGNIFEHTIVDHQTGPATLFSFENGGTGNSLYNANVTYIRHLWVVDNSSAMTSVADARRSSETVFEGGNIENNPAATLTPGTNTTIREIFMESNATPSFITPASGTDGSSNGVHVLNNHFSTPQTITIGSALTGWEFIGNWPKVNVIPNEANGTNTITQNGRTFYFGAPDGGLILKNTSTGGAQNELRITGSGSGLGAGFYNIDQFSTTRMGLMDLGLNYFRAGASNQSSGMFVAKDDLNPSTKELNVVKADANTSVFSVTKLGDVTGTSFTGPLTGNVTGNASGTAANVTGIVAAANGGTGANNTVGAAGHYLRSNGTTYVDSAIVGGDVPTLNQSTTGNAATATALAANGTNCSAGNYPLGVDASGNAESCTAAGGGSIPTGTGFRHVTAGVEDAASKKVDLATTVDVTGTLPLGNGGTNATTAQGAFNSISTLTTKGDLHVHDGTNNTRLAVGTNGRVLTADSTATAGMAWQDNNFIYSDTSTTTLTGTAADANLYSTSFTIAAGRCVQAFAGWTFSTATAVAKTMKWKFGATAVNTYSGTSSSSTGLQGNASIIICNAGSSTTSQQIVPGMAAYGTALLGGAASSTGTNDTSSSVTLSFIFNAAATEVATRRLFMVEYIR